MRLFFDIEADECVTEVDVFNIYAFVQKQGLAQAMTYNEFLTSCLESEGVLEEVRLTDQQVREVANEIIKLASKQSLSENWNIGRGELDKMAGCILTNRDIIRIENMLWVSDGVLAVADIEDDLSSLEIIVCT